MVGATGGGWAGTEECEPTQLVLISGQSQGVADPRLLLAFDLSGLPEDAIVQHAGLRLADQTALAWSVPFVPVVAAGLTTQWDPASASWESASGSQAWDTPGGDWDPALSAYRAIVKKAEVAPELVVTEIVRRWISGSIPNYGLIVMMPDPEELADVVPYFNSQFLKPVLTVRYVEPE
jgi:hypothetical protein